MVKNRKQRMSIEDDQSKINMKKERMKIYLKMLEF